MRSKANTENRVELNVIGLGLKGMDQLPLASLRIMRSADIILFLAPIEQELLLFGFSDIESLEQYYVDDDIDMVNYQRILKRIMAVARRAKNIAFLLQGHPRVGVTLISLLEKKFPPPRHRVNVFEGISSFDAMINDLRIDPLERGCQLYDVNRMILFNYPINKFADLFLYHISSIGESRTKFRHNQGISPIGILKNYLLKTYEPSKKIIVIAAAQNNSPGLTVSVSLKQMETVASNISYTTSIFIRGENTRVHNHSFMELISDKMRR